MQSNLSQDSLAWTRFFPYVLLRLGGMSIVHMQGFRSEALAGAVAEYWAAKRTEEKAKEELQERLDDAIQQASPGMLRSSLYQCRARFFKDKNVLWERVLPDLNADAAGWSTQMTQTIWDWEHSQIELKLAVDAYEFAYSAAYVESLKTLQSSLTPSFKLGLSAASQSLSRAALKFEKKKPPFKNNKKNRQTALGLWQYIARTGAKTSPLGAFGPIALLDVEQWPTDLPPFSFDKMKAAPNVGLLPLFYAILEENGKLHYESPISLSPSISVTDEAFVFLSYSEGQEKIQQLEKNETLLFLYQLLEEPQRFKYLAKRVNRLTGVPKLECIDYVQQLVDIGFLDWKKPLRGLSPDWANQLMQFLAFLPDDVCHQSCMDMLRHLHSTTKAYPHASASQRLEIQNETAEKFTEFCASQQFDAIGMPPPAFFYEDKIVDALVDFSSDELAVLVESLRAAFQALWRFPLSQNQAIAYSFYQKNYAKNTPVPFLVFIENLLRDPEILTATVAKSKVGYSVENMPVGALLQPFRQADGTLAAVLNALHFGGGKMSNRFLPLLPDKVRHTLSNWNQLNDGLCSAELAWGSATNSNFHSTTASCSLHLPDGHPVGEIVVPMHQIFVRPNGVFGDFLELFDIKSGLTLLVLNNTPEASDSYPPVLQWLRTLGMPYVSSRLFKNMAAEKQSSENLGNYQSSTRRFLPNSTIVLQRAQWSIPTKDFPKEKNADFYKELFTFFRLHKLPIAAYFYVQGDKPQYLDLQNPLSVLYFEKYLAQQAKLIYIEEALPSLEQSLFRTSDGKHVGELALEFRV